MPIMSCWCDTVPCSCPTPTPRPTAFEKKIEELETELAATKRRVLTGLSRNHELTVRYQQLLLAVGNTPRAQHAIKLADHLLYGLGVMLEEPKRDAWLRDHPWPED